MIPSPSPGFVVVAEAGDLFRGEGVGEGGPFRGAPDMDPQDLVGD